MKVAQRVEATLERPVGQKRAVLSIDHVWAFAALSIPVVVALAGALSMVDLAYHVRAGEFILSAHRLPGVDTYTFSAAGHAWLDQQWGAQVVFALAHRAGWPGLTILRGVLLGATFAFLWLACRARGADLRAASLLTMGSLVVSLTNLGMRPQAVAFPLFTASLWIIARRREHPRGMWLIPALAIPWANIHGSFVLAPIIVGLCVLEDLAERADTIRSTLCVAVATVLATLANPFGVGAWVYAAGIGTNPTIRHGISEWAPTSVATLTGLSFFVSGALVALFLVRRGERTRWTDIVWLGTFFALGLPALRGAAWWAFVAPVVVAGLLPNHAGATPSRRRGSPLLNGIVVVALISLAAPSLPWLHAAPDPRTGSSALLSYAPKGVLDATSRAVPSGTRLFVWQPWGSWFEFGLPSDPVLVDSRIEILPATAWNDYEAVLAGVSGWQSTLTKWNVGAVVLPKRGTKLLRFISADPGWRLAYRDAEGSVFVPS